MTAILNKLKFPILIAALVAAFSLGYSMGSDKEEIRRLQGELNTAQATIQEQEKINKDAAKKIQTLLRAHDNERNLTAERLRQLEALHRSYADASRLRNQRDRFAELAVRAEDLARRSVNRLSLCTK